MDLDVVAARRLLGVQEGASEAQVRAAYRAMLKAWHPDCVGRKLSPRDPRAAVEPLRTDPVLAGFSDEALVRIAEIVAADREEQVLDEALAYTQEIIGAARTLRNAPAPSKRTRSPLVYQSEPPATGARPRVRTRRRFGVLAFALVSALLATPRAVVEAGDTTFFMVENVGSAAPHPDSAQNDPVTMEQQQQD